MKNKIFTWGNGKRAFWLFLMVINIVGFVRGEGRAFYELVGFIIIVIAGIYNVVNVSDD